MHEIARRRKSHLHRERGAILAATLMLVFVLSLVATAAMQSAGLEGKMARNYIDRGLAFQSAEAALRDAESSLKEATSRPSVTSECNSPPCVLESSLLEPDWWKTADDDFWSNNGKRVGNAYYIIEEGPFVPDALSIGHSVPTGRNFYTLTSKGTEQTNSSLVILQGAFVKRFN